MSSTTPAKRKQVLSAIQPTGSLHLGRYFGAIQNWVNLQETYDCVYGMVDYHAMTMPFDPKRLRDQVWNLAFDLVAVGLKPDYMFIQSMIPEHAELAWIFNCMSSYGEVSRMTQFKDKSQQVAEKDKDSFISTGLFAYPVLQAADILIYKADFVPVGKDQQQHLELTRNIAQRFNQTVGKEYFVLPEILFTETPKVLSTADPSKKMSASLGPKHHINVFSDPDVIRKQIKTAVTDLGIYIDNKSGIKLTQTETWEFEDRSGNLINMDVSPGVGNLFTLLKASGGKMMAEELRFDLYDKKQIYGRLKEEVADHIIKLTDPFREKRIEVENNSTMYKDEIIESSAEIRKKAQETIREVKDLIGLMNYK